MSSLRAICRPHMVFSSFMCCRNQARLALPFRNNCSYKSGVSSLSSFSPWFDTSDVLRNYSAYRVNSRRTLVRATKWTDEKSPYETLVLERDADEEKIKSAYRRLAKYYHPDGLFLNLNPAFFKM
uniref:J domain-containing protein n=1 Tax=Nelumbo nucifera TaxID=4432 RepID=A0A822XRS2_NELNU|nr:TPA_asm: hypothetical protein HUJ06_023304 [Nelumbo nucifera]